MALSDDDYDNNATSKTFQTQIIFQYAGCIPSALHSYAKSCISVQSLGTRKAYKLNERVTNNSLL
jgi:hypothetical protein